MRRGFSISDGFEKRRIAYHDRRKYNDLTFSKTVLESVFSKSYCRDEFRERREAHANLVMGHAPKRRNKPFFINPLYQLPSFSLYCYPRARNCKNSRKSITTGEVPLLSKGAGIKCPGRNRRVLRSPAHAPTGLKCF